MFDLGFELVRPPRWYFDFPPQQEPPAVPPPQDVFDWRSPINVDPAFYRAVLEPKVPLTMAVVYFFTVKIMNQVNRRRGFKPYAFSKTTAWWLFCVVHNICLALYSGVTFAAMVRAMYVSLPGFLGPRGIPGQLDAMCKMHGPRGWGDAVQYSPSSNAWHSTNHFIRLGPDGRTPDDTDVGRIWNEGLAFWGWLFYLSKFYEVVDTAIILASGKRSATLQTYHHTGAMLCMWAGIRFMSPPIWLFCYLNSFIHTVMYTYYTLHLFRVQVPKRFKRVLTTAQIMQFLIGVYFATIHLFVTYKIPVSVPVSTKVALSAASSAVYSAASAATSADWAWLRKLALRAANFEGAAENIWTGTTEKYASVPGSASKAVDEVREFRYRTEYQTVRCIDTQGQAFAIWLNVVYLAPLTFLFGRFFFKAYLRGQQAPQSARQPVKVTGGGAVVKTNGQPSAGTTIQTAVDEAAINARDELERQGAALERRLDSTVVTSEEVRSAIEELSNGDGGDDFGLEARLRRLERELNESHLSATTHESNATEQSLQLERQRQFEEQQRRIEQEEEFEQEQELQRFRQRQLEQQQQQQIQQQQQQQLERQRLQRQLEEQQQQQQQQQQEEEQNQQQEQSSSSTNTTSASSKNDNSTTSTSTSSTSASTRAVTMTTTTTTNADSSSSNYSSTASTRLLGDPDVESYADAVKDELKSGGAEQ